MSSFPCLVRVVSGSGEVRYRLGERLVDWYLEFVAGRCRPNTLRAVAFDLKTFFVVTGKDPVQVTAADVFDFLAHQRGDRTVVRLADRESGLSARTIARRLSSVSGLYAYLVARGDTPVRVNPVPRGLLTRRQGGTMRSRVAPLVRVPRTPCTGTGPGAARAPARVASGTAEPLIRARLSGRRAGRTAAAGASGAADGCPAAASIRCTLVARSRRTFVEVSCMARAARLALVSGLAPAASSRSSRAAAQRASRRCHGRSRRIVRLPRSSQSRTCLVRPWS